MKPNHIAYRPDIDGLRAIAIVAVVIFHAYKDFLSGGFVGVDIFFVISGFLISTILFKNIENNQFSIVDFYIRRVRRIFPALLTVMLATMLTAWYVLFLDEFSTFGRHLSAGIAFISNIVFWRESGYFDLSSETKPLLHFWSLAVEEQFYLFWPVLLAILWKRKMSILNILCFLAIASFLLNITFISSRPEATFFLPITRFWELIAGGILAYLMLYRQQAQLFNNQLKSVVGLLLILFSIVFIQESWGFPGWWAVLPVLGAVLMIAAGPNAWVNQRLLSNPVMIWIGKISYTLYLWHWPLLSFAFIIKQEPLDATEAFGVVILSFVFAHLTYAYIENPIRFGKYKVQAIPVMLVSMCLLLVVSLSILLGYISPRSHSPALAEVIAARNDYANINPQFSQFRFDNERFYRFNNASNESAVLIGDSHALQYVPRVNQLVEQQSDQLRDVTLAIHEGCMPVPGMPETESDFKERGCKRYRESILKLVDNPNIKSIALAACWNCYLLKDYERDSKFIEDNKSATEPLKSHILASLKAFLSHASKTKTVYLVLDNPVEYANDPSRYLKGNRVSQFYVSEIPKEIPFGKDQAELRETLLNVAKEAGAIVIDPSSAICHQGQCALLDQDGRPIYRDNNHLRASYVKNNVRFLDQVFIQ